MQELEKILEEIDKNTISLFSGVNMISAKKVEKILRKHMDGGWIPAEKGLPEESGYYLVQLSEKLPNENYSDRVVVLYGEEDKEFMCYSSLIVDWRPLPEPYRPERIMK